MFQKVKLLFARAVTLSGAVKRVVFSFLVSVVIISVVLTILTFYYTDLLVFL